MDDLKVYAQTPRQLKYILDIITTFSGDINMKLGVNKRKIMEIVKTQRRTRIPTQGRRNNNKYE
jgi:uncharacterized protein YrrD